MVSRNSGVRDTTRKDTVDSRANFVKLKGMYSEHIVSPLGLGWGQSKPTTWWDWLTKVVGWLLTGVAVTMGAPFWFEMLKKLLALKGSTGGGNSSPPPSRTDQAVFEIKPGTESGKSTETEDFG